MRLLITILLTILLFSCGKQEEELPCANVDRSTDYSFEKTYTVQGTNNGERIILFHGIFGSSASFDGGAGKRLVDALLADGKQIVTVSYPMTTNGMFYNGGRLYRERFKSFMSWLINDLDTNQGTAAKNIVGGFSFGGTHAILTAVDNSTYFDNVVAVAPALDIRTVIPSYLCESNTHFNLLSEADNIQTLNAYVTIGDADTIVHWKEVQGFFDGYLSHSIHTQILHTQYLQMKLQILLIFYNRRKAPIGASKSLALFSISLHAFS